MCAGGTGNLAVICVTERCSHSVVRRAIETSGTDRVRVRVSKRDRVTVVALLAVGA